MLGISYGELFLLIGATAARVHKELQDALAQLELIRYEVRSISPMNPGPLTRKLMDDSRPGSYRSLENPKEELKSTSTVLKDRTPEYVNLHSRATAYERLVESDAVKTGSLKRSAEKENHSNESGLFAVLPVSAESSGMLPNRKENVEGSDIVLEAVFEAKVARNAKDFFSHPANQIQ